VYYSIDPCRWQYFVYIYYAPIAGIARNSQLSNLLRDQAVWIIVLDLSIISLSIIVLEKKGRSLSWRKRWIIVLEKRVEHFLGEKGGALFWERGGAVTWRKGWSIVWEKRV
jgi:hypothetical protein